MKIGVLSDIHLSCDDGRVENIIDQHFNGIDDLFLCGDLTSISILDLFADKTITAVAGNMDDALVKQTLPYQLTKNIGGVKFGLVHGWGAPTGIEARIAQTFPDDIDCIVYGHSHAPQNKVIGNTLFFNPGSPTDKRCADHHTIGILTLTGGRVSGEIIRI